MTLRTNYIAKTHVNTYARLWAEILLGDLQNNILAILQQRAEAVHQGVAFSPLIAQSQDHRSPAALPYRQP